MIDSDIKGIILNVNAIAIGVDLAAREQNDTGVCILNRKAILKVVRGDEELIQEITAASPRIVAIDAPLTLPAGRCCFASSCDCMNRGKNLRSADRELISKGYRVFPPGFAWMKDLTMRGIKLRRLLEKKFRVIEVHPRTSLLALNWREADVYEYLEKKGYGNLNPKNEHEFDAIICAITGLLHLEGKTIRIGDEGEGQIVIPEK